MVKPTLYLKQGLSSKIQPFLAKMADFLDFPKVPEVASNGFVK